QRSGQDILPSPPEGSGLPARRGRPLPVAALPSADFRARQRRKSQATPGHERQTAPFRAARRLAVRLARPAPAEGAALRPRNVPRQAVRCGRGGEGRKEVPPGQKSQAWWKGSSGWFPCSGSRKQPSCTGGRVQSGGALAPLWLVSGFYRVFQSTQARTFRLHQYRHVPRLVLITHHLGMGAGNVLPGKNLAQATIGASLDHRGVGLSGLFEVGSVAGLDALLAQPNDAGIHGAVVARGTGTEDHHSAALHHEAGDGEGLLAWM